MNQQQYLENLVIGELENLGFELVKLETPTRGRKRILRIYIDCTDRDVTLDDCVRVTKMIGFVLDGEDLMPGSYNLEVSSPGMNRSLTKPEHFVRFRGRRAKVERKSGDSKKTLIGKIMDADGVGVSLLVGGVRERIIFEDIIKANLYGERWEIAKGKKKKKRTGREPQQKRF